MEADRAATGRPPLSWSQRIRQLHRWLSVAFTVAVLVNIGVNAAGNEALALWVGLGTLPLILLLLVTGLYLFVLPFASS